MTQKPRQSRFLGFLIYVGLVVAWFGALFIVTELRDLVIGTLKTLHGGALDADSARVAALIIGPTYIVLEIASLVGLVFSIRAVVMVRRRNRKTLEATAKSEGTESATSTQQWESSIAQSGNHYCPTCNIMYPAADICPIHGTTLTRLV